MVQHAYGLVCLSCEFIGGLYLDPPQVPLPIGPAAFGAAVLVGFGAGAVGGQVGRVLAALGVLVGLLMGSVVDRRLAAVEP